MPYSVENYPTKKALKAAVAAGPVPVFQPGPFGPEVRDGQHCIEGPHYPKPHTFYATVEVVNQQIIRVLS